MNPDPVLQLVDYLTTQADIYDRIVMRAYLHRDQRTMALARILRDAYDRAAEQTFRLGVRDV
jgi:hypothetical protein